MRIADFSLQDPSAVITPSLLYHLGAMEENLRTTIAIAGDVKRLWPHVKSHKTRELIERSIQHGITRFKCATIAEAETAARAGAGHVLLAYPLVGPNIARFLQLSRAFPQTTFWATGDSEPMLRQLADAATDAGIVLPVLLDVNTGLDRTGVSLQDAHELYRSVSSMKGLHLRGLHCYDGQNHQSSVEQRSHAVEEINAAVLRLKQGIRADGLCCDTVILGGTPSFPMHARMTEDFLSPGTTFLFDSGYGTAFPDLDLCVAAAVLTRVVSHPKQGLFTLDLGYKGIASDPPDSRGILLGVPHASSCFQNEEHWVFKMDEGHEDARPPLGSVLYVIPAHICPTSALYKSALIVQDGSIVDEWNIVARDRKLEF